LTSQSSGPAATAASAAETEHRIYLRSHRQRRNQQLQQLQIQQQQQQQQVAANLTLRPWTRSRAQQVLHHYQLEQLHSSGIIIIFFNFFITFS